ncbi:MAG: cyclic nucleotide-binding/CBS domain-containing protein, partial [Candidatus Promineifilaceae bacterium]
MSDDGSSPRLVRDLMSVGVLTCSPDTSVVELTRILLEKDLEAAVVLDVRGHAAGIVSRDDLVKVYATGDDVQDLAVEAMMQDGVPQIPPDIPLTAAAQIMQDRSLRIIFLMHHAGGIEYPAAMLSYTHLLRHMAMESLQDLADLGIKADRESPLEAFYKR